MSASATDVAGDVKINAEDNVNYYKGTQVVREVDVARWCSDPEINAILLRKNPVVLSVLSAGATYGLLDQFFKLWPSIKSTYSPYFSIPSIAMGLTGFLIGAQSFISPRSTGYSTQALLAFIEGTCAIFPFTLGEVIEIYRKKCDDSQGNCDIDDYFFFEGFFTPTFLAGLIYTAWKLIPIVKKQNYSLQSKSKEYFIRAMDFFFDTLLFSRVSQALAQLVYPSISEPLIYEYISVPMGASVVAAIQAQIECLKRRNSAPNNREVIQNRATKYLERVYTGLLWGMSSVITYTYGSQIYQAYKNPSATWSAALQTAFMSVYIIGGCTLCILYARKSRKETIRIENITAIDRAALEREIAGKYIAENQTLKDELEQRRELSRHSITTGLLNEAHGSSGGAEFFSVSPLSLPGISRPDPVDPLRLAEPTASIADITVNPVTPVTPGSSAAPSPISSGRASPTPLTEVILNPNAATLIPHVDTSAEPNSVPVTMAVAYNSKRSSTTPLLSSHTLPAIPKEDAVKNNNDRGCVIA